jgi:secreted trypsin-like serine protease
MKWPVQTTAWLLATVVIVTLGACEKIRLPVVNPVETPANPAPPVTPGAGETPAPPADPGLTPVADPAVPAGPGVGTGPAPTLASLNAARCGLPTGSPPTPTIAMVAGATTLEEPMFGAQAVNAAAASIASFPGIVKIEPRTREAGGNIASGHCGATRISRNWLITAAHCVDEQYEEIRVIGEAANLRNPAAKITDATLAICHAGYQGVGNGYANDVALVRLSDTQVSAIEAVPIARFGSTLKPLAPANYDAADMAGWGLTRYGGQLSADLLTASLKVTGSGPAVIYVASKGGAGPCIGDSGGPLYVSEADGSKTVVGVLSVVEQNRTTGEFCSGDYNGRYTNLQGFTGWISDVMALCDRGDEACT